MNYWDNTSSWEVEEKEESIIDKRKKCWHDWKKILLLSLTVEDCTRCGIHREKYERGVFDNGEKSKSIL